MSQVELEMTHEQLVHQFAFDVGMLPSIDDLADDQAHIPYKAIGLKSQFPQAIAVNGFQHADYAQPLFLNGVLELQFDFINQSLTREVTHEEYVLAMYQLAGSRSVGQVVRIQNALDDSGVFEFYSTIPGVVV